MIVKAVQADVTAVAALYEAVNTALTAGINYPGWHQDVYPTKHDAQTALEEGTLFIAKEGETVTGTVILNNCQPQGYETVDWGFACDENEVLVVHTLAVHPDAAGKGTGKALMEFALQHAQQTGMSCIRLDVTKINTPAIALYEKSGYTYQGLADLGLSAYGIDTLRVYQRIL